MTAFNISGLVSGIDTSSLIDQLMTAAAAPQQSLQKKVAADQADIAAYQSVNTKLAAIATAAKALADPATWQNTTATSSESSVIATGSTSAQPGAYTTFSVLKVATAQVTTVAATGGTVADPNATIKVVGSDGVEHDINSGDGTAASVAAAVNSAGLGLRAAVITTDGGPVLQFTSTGTGASAAFTLDGLNGTAKTLVTAQDAQVAVGDPANGGYTISSSTNTFANAIPGVTFTVSKPVSNVTISVATDQKSISDGVQSLVNAVNAALTEIGTDTAQGAVLAGDTTLETLQQQLLGVVSAGTSTGGTLSTWGVSLTSNGQLTYDPKAFAAAYSADPARTVTALTAFSTSMSGLANAATDPSTGSVTGLLNAENSEVKSLNSQISDWTTRLADQKQMLQTKYAAMEAALARMKSQSSYLSSMFNQGNSNSSSSGSSNSN